jgi:uncharacterized membrane protein
MREGMRESVPSALAVTAGRLRAAFAIASVTWTFLLALAPLLTTRAHASALGTGIVVAVYAVGSHVCHQLPARSFELWSAQMPVCARCTGIYLGSAAYVPLALRWTTASATAHAARRRLALAVLPSAATLVYEWTTGVAPSNWIRFAAGLPIGAATAWLVVAASRNQVN